MLDIAPGTWEFRVFAVNWAGNDSATAATVTLPITGLSDVPAAPTGLSHQVVGGGTLAELHWDASPDLDVLVGGRAVFRHSPLLEGASWADGTSFGLPQPGNLTAALLPAKTGTVMMKFQDGSGIYSAGFAATVCRQGGMLGFTVLGSVVEDPAFAGGKDGMFVDETGTLLIAGADDFDSVADVDALVSWDFPEGVRLGVPFELGDPVLGFSLGDPVQGYVLGKPDLGSGSYDFATVLDLGSVQHCRLTSTISAQVRNLLDDFDSRSGDSDSWASWDGDVAGDEADGALFVQTTQDDPASPSATWTDWNRLDTSEHHIRGARFRFVAWTRDPNFNLATTGLGVVAEAVA